MFALDQAINPLRFDYEEQLYQRLLTYEEVKAWHNDEKRQQYFTLHQRHLLGTAVKITSTLKPTIYKIYQQCLQRLGENFTGDLYVRQSSDYNAQVYAHEQHFDILLTSSLVNAFTENELSFVIGHELGHVLFQHAEVPSNYLLFNEERPKISTQLAQRLFQWSRAAEISADRVGFLMCGDLSTAATAFFKVAGGLAVENELHVVQSLRTQFADIQHLATKTVGFTATTHPLIPIRFKSLELMSLDLLQLRNNHTLPQADMLRKINQQVQTVLMQTDPVNLLL